MPRNALKHPGEYRQSLLAGMEKCPRRTKADIQLGDYTAGWTESSADLGTVGHAVFAAILEALRHPEWGDLKPDGSKEISTQEAVEIMYEQVAAADVVLPYTDLEALLGMVLTFATFKFRPQSILCIEQRLRLPIECPDGVVRVLKGQPDLVTSNPPTGLVIEDFKTGRGVPRTPRDKSLIHTVEGVEVVIGRKYLSDRGHFQGDTYGLLALKGFLDDGTQISPSATHVDFRERHIRSNAQRLMRLTRDDLEHVRRRIGLKMMQVDQAIQDGARSKLWKPRPGSHCNRQCPVARSCPVPREQRGDGAIDSQAAADRAAAAFAVADAQREQIVAQSKAWTEDGNPPGKVNEHEELRWGPDPGAWAAKGGRGFKIWPTDGNGNEA
jgi:hypothetical protein